MRYSQEQGGIVRVKLVNRIFYGYLLVVVISTLVTTAMAAVFLSRAVRSEAISRVQLGLQDARAKLEDRSAALAVQARLLSLGLEDRVELDTRADFAVRLSAPLPGFLTAEGLAGAASARGTLLVSTSELEDIGVALTALDRVTTCPGGGLLVQFALVQDTSGAALVGSLLNGNEELVRRLQRDMFGSEAYGGKPFGTVTIFCRDLRVATTVVGPRGRVALGTAVSAEVRRRVLEEGQPWLQRALVVDEWYLSAYEPLRDPCGDNIGILYVGVLERKYADLGNRAVLTLAALNVPVLGLALVAAFFIARGIVRPLDLLARATAELERGNFDTSITAAGGPEVLALTAGFQRMRTAIRDREERLRLKNIDLERANRDYQELLSFVTHELNNSIGSLMLNAGLLEEDAERYLAQEQRELVQQVLRDVERFRDMVRNYLNLSRLEKGTLRFNPVSNDLRSRVIEPVLERLSRWIIHRRFHVQWEWPEEVLVQADPDLLDICYSNFIVNAVKYGQGWLRLSARRDGTRWVLGVTNGGTPIAPEKIPLLFRKFSRLVGSDDGAGLGLYLVRMIVERHGGRVWCESVGRPGTTFFMSIPAASPAAG